MSLHQDNIPIFELTDEKYRLKTPIDNNDYVFKNNTDLLVYQFLSKNNTGKTREQICKELDLPRSSVFDALNRLSLTNLVETDFKIKSKSRKGRPSTIYYLKNVIQGGNR